MEQLIEVVVVSFIYNSKSNDTARIADVWNTYFTKLQEQSDLVLVNKQLQIQMSSSATTSCS